MYVTTLKGAKVWVSHTFFERKCVKKCGVISFLLLKKAKKCGIMNMYIRSGTYTGISTLQCVRQTTKGETM